MEGKFEGTTTLCLFVTCTSDCCKLKFIAEYGEVIYIILYITNEQKYRFFTQDVVAFLVSITVYTI
jgi:hypothetical protein